jgi:hypothetical protein
MLMHRFSIVLMGFAVGLCPVEASVAAPQTYSYTTHANSYGSSPAAGFFDSSAFVSGSFTYDFAADHALTTGGLEVYGSYSPASSLTPSLTSLAGTVAGLSFSDIQGVALVADDTFNSGGTLVDFFSLNADPGFTNTTSERNIDGFSVGAYKLMSVRLFWGETFTSPELIPDFIAGTALLPAPPSFHGRLALDFVDATTGAPAGSVFFDGLAVASTAPIPEPETYAMLLAGLGLLGFVAQRRRALLPG